MPAYDTLTGDTSEAQDLTPPFQGDTSEMRDLPPQQTMAPRDWARSGGGDTLNVAKAQRIIKAFTDDPSWLADPRTAHAANSVFSAATKVVGMNIQLERLNSKADAARAQSSTGNKVGQSLLKLAEGGGDGAEWASQWYAPGENGKAKYEDPNNWESILKGYKQFSVDRQEFADTVELEDGTILQGLRNPKTGVFKVQKTPKSESDEYAVKEFDGHKFLTGSGFKPIPLNSLTPEKKIEAQVSMETLRSLRKMTEESSDPEERKNLILRQQNVMKVLREITSPATVTNAPTTSPSAAPSKYGSESDARAAGAKSGDVIYLDGIGKVRLK